MPLQVNGKGRGAVVDAVLRSQSLGSQTDAPGVPAVAQKVDAPGLIVRKTRPDQIVNGLLPMCVDGGAVVHAVQNHMDM